MKLEELKEYLNIDETEYDLPFEVSSMITEMRVVRGLTQEDLAKKAGTKQPAVARAENCVDLPSLSFLKKLADAMDMEITIGFRKQPNRD